MTLTTLAYLEQESGITGEPSDTHFPFVKYKTSNNKTTKKQEPSSHQSLSLFLSFSFQSQEEVFSQ